MGKVRSVHYSGIGGMAVMDGVMMRNKDKYAIAIRQPDGHISLKVESWHSFFEGSVLLKLPFIRGIFAFIDSMRLSFRCMGEGVLQSEEAPESARRGSKKTKEKSSFSKFMDQVATGGMFVLSFLMAVALFILFPYFVARYLTVLIRSEALLSLVEGILRIIIFVLYILLISRLKDIRTMFCYHGAEHKCINCIESGLELTVENVRKSSKLHKRCGSSFILFVMLVSIVLFFFIRVDSVFLRLLLRILLLPVISGIAYELIRLAGRYDNAFVRLLSAPGFAMQGLTTKEPDDEMIEVGIESVEAVFDWRAYRHDIFGV